MRLGRHYTWGSSKFSYEQLWRDIAGSAVAPRPPWRSPAWGCNWLVSFRGGAAPSPEPPPAESWPGICTGTARNLAESSGTFIYHLHWNFWKPSGTLSRSADRSTAELIIGWRPPVLRCSQTNNPDQPIIGFGSCKERFLGFSPDQKGPKKSAVPRNTTLSGSGSCKECLPCCFHIQTGPPTRARCLKIRPLWPSHQLETPSRSPAKSARNAFSVSLQGKKSPLCCCGYKETIASPSSPLQGPFTLKPPWSPLKPPWSPLKPPWSPLEGLDLQAPLAPLKPPWRSRPASPLQAPFKPLRAFWSLHDG